MCYKHRWTISVLVMLALMITTLCLVLASYDAVEPDELGLKYNTRDRKIEAGEPYKPGNYFVGLQTRFHIFKSTYQTLNFGSDTDCDSSRVFIAVCKDYAPVTVLPKGNPNKVTTRFSVQFVLRPDQLRTLYDTYKFDYAMYFERKVRTELQYAGQHYQMNQFFYERGTIEQVMRNKVNQTLDKLGADMVTFHMQDIQLPKAQEDRLQNLVLRQYSLLIGEEQGELSKDNAKSEDELRRYGSEVSTFQTALSQFQKIEIDQIKANETKEIARTNKEVGAITAQNEQEVKLYTEETNNKVAKLQQNISSINSKINLEVARIAARYNTEKVKYEQETTDLVATKLAQEKAEIRLTAQQVQKQENEHQRWLVDFNQETAIKEQAILRQVQQEQEQTRKELAKTNQSLGIKRSQADSDIFKLRATSASRITVLNQATASFAQRLHANVTKAVHQGLVDALSFSASDLLLLQYIESIQSGEVDMLEIKTPSIFTAGHDSI